MSWSRSLNQFNYDSKFDPRYQGYQGRDGDDPDYPFRDTRPLHWQNPSLADRYPNEGQFRCEKRTIEKAQPETEAMSDTRCRYEENDFKSNETTWSGSYAWNKKID